MQYLIIDTSGSKNFSTLVLGNQEETVFLPPTELTKSIHISLMALFQSHRISPIDLEFIAICNGPGFFTGIRIGVSIAKALSYTSQVPLIPFHSLELLEAEPHQAKILDARGGKVYISYGESPPFICPISEISKNIPTTITELISADTSQLTTDYPLFEKPFTPRREEKNWQRRVALGQTEDHLTFKIEYLH